MNKKIILIYILFVTVTFSQQVFKSETYGFEITFPDYMVVNKGTTGNPAVIASVNNNTSLNVVLQEDTDTVNKSMNDYELEGYINTLKNTLANDLPAFTPMDYGRKDINGSASIYLEYKYYKGNDVLRVKQYFLKNISYMYGITAICPEPEAAEYEIMFNDIVNSFKFIK